MHNAALYHVIIQACSKNVKNVKNVERLEYMYEAVVYSGSTFLFILTTGNSAVMLLS